MMIRRIFNDKEIGRILFNKNIGSRFYCVKQSEWDEYSNTISNRYLRDYTNNTLNNVLTDTVVSHSDKIRDLSNSHYHHSEEIRDLKIHVGDLNKSYLHIKEDLYHVKNNNEFVTFEVLRQLEYYSKKLTDICEKVDELTKK